MGDDQEQLVMSWGIAVGVADKLCVAELVAMAFGVCFVECCVQLLKVGWLADNGVRSGGLWQFEVFVLLCSMWSCMVVGLVWYEPRGQG